MLGAVALLDDPTEVFGWLLSPFFEAFVSKTLMRDLHVRGCSTIGQPNWIFGQLFSQYLRYSCRNYRIQICMSGAVAQLADAPSLFYLETLMSKWLKRNLHSGDCSANERPDRILGQPIFEALMSKICLVFGAVAQLAERQTEGGRWRLSRCACAKCTPLDRRTIGCPQ
jgi:hypothetical protein